MIRPILQSLRREHMDVTLRNGRDHTVRIVERPGVWMNDADLAALTADLRTIADKTLGHGELNYGVFSGGRAHLCDTIVTFVTLPDGTPIAFNALVIMTLETVPDPTPVLHLGLMMVDPDQQSSGLSWVLYGLTCFLLFAVCTQSVSPDLCVQCHAGAERCWHGVGHVFTGLAQT
jgi:hypothetical protein